ncbi:MAG: hypothetical protein DRG31_05985, partial [Deltaproteobacteria bacterium]
MAAEKAFTTRAGILLVALKALKEVKDLLLELPRDTNSPVLHHEDDPPPSSLRAAASITSLSPGRTYFMA